MQGNDSDVMYKMTWALPSIIVTYFYSGCTELKSWMELIKDWDGLFRELP